MLVEDLMIKSGVKFGTSGARGLASEITDQISYAYTTAFLQHLEANNEINPGSQMALAGDLRPSTDRIMAASAKAIADKGYEPINGGKVPSPAVALHGITNQIPTVMVTGSHIPDDRNGIKYTKASGEILKKDELGIKAQDVNWDESLFDENGMFKQAYTLAEVDPAIEENYINRYLDFFGPDALKGIKIGLYQHSAVGRHTLSKIYKGMGADLVELGFSDTFIPVDTEAIRDEDTRLANQWAQENSYASILSTDGDSDRPLISDENGKWLRGDVAGILCAQYLKATTVATPVSCNSSLEKCGLFPNISRTQIGSPFVISAMNQAADGEMVIGYEANGGFLMNTDFTNNGKVLKALPTRDAVILHIAIILLAKDKQTSVSGLVGELPQRFTASNRLQDYPTEESQKKLALFTQGKDSENTQIIEETFGSISGKVQSTDLTDGLRITFANSEVIHLRPSGNAPELRCYNEADSEERVLEMNQLCMNVLNQWKG
ncbi:MAG: phosphomannomutase [Planctomycetes bacterium]|nr:phosphomannomutase [Planctomycetota bacterium]